MTLSNQLNLSTDLRNIPDRAVILDTRRDIAIYDTLCLYCSNNNISLTAISDIDFHATSDLIDFYCKSRKPQYNQVAFWLTQ